MIIKIQQALVGLNVRRSAVGWLDGSCRLIPKTPQFSVKLAETEEKMITHHNDHHPICGDQAEAAAETG